MKKTILKIFVIALLMQILVLTKVYANNDGDFAVHAKEAMEVNAGETIEVPIIISNIQANDIQKGIVGLKFKIEYDKEAFELEKFDNGSYFNRFVGTSNSTFNEEELISVIYCDDDDYIDQVTDLGTIKVKAKEGIKTGYYDLSITNIEGGNLDSTNMNISSPSVTSPIYVHGIDEEEAEGPEIVISDGGNVLGETDSSTIFNSDSVVAQFEQNKEGTLLKITIDEEKGKKVSKILIDENEMELVSGVFSANVEPGNTYVLKFYDEDGNYITMNSVTITPLEKDGIIAPAAPMEPTPTSEDEGDKKDEEPKDSEGEDEKKDEETKDTEKEDDKKDEDTKDAQKEDNNKENIDKSAQTGDEIGVAVAVLIVASAVLGTSVIVKNEFEE